MKQTKKEKEMKKESPAKFFERLDRRREDLEELEAEHLDMDEHDVGMQVKIDALSQKIHQMEKDGAKMVRPLTIKQKAELFDVLLGRIGTICHKFSTEAKWHRDLAKDLMKGKNLRMSWDSKGQGSAFASAGLTLERAALEAIGSTKIWAHFDKPAH